MSQTPLQYVTCYCHKCNNGIEFDWSLLAPENCVIPCPHCGKLTVLQIPAATYGLPKFEGQKPSTVREIAKRVTLTKSQSASPAGQVLLNLLKAIDDDGIITLEEARRLNRWLSENEDTEMPAVDFLLQITNRIMADGKVEQDEVYELQLAIERVVPKDVREELKEKRRIAYYNSPATENQLEYLRRLGVNPRSEISRSTASELIDETLRQAPATERQLNYIRDLGGNVPPEMSKRQASELIDELLEQEARQGPTHRQMMVLRFWNRLDMAHSSKDEITDWLSRFYKEDPRRKAAWDIFKVDSGDAGLQGDPSFVPLGAGEEYLQALRGVFPTS